VWSGVAHFVEHMLFKSTTRHRAPELLMPLYLAGGSINGATSEEQTVYHAVAGPSALPVLADTLCEILREPAFLPDEVERERTVLLNELQRHRADAETWFADDVLPMLAFANDASLAHSTGGSLDGLERVDLDLLLAFTHVLYRPERMCLSVYGNLEQRAPRARRGTVVQCARRWLEDVFGVWEGPPSSLRAQDPARFAAYVDAIERHVRSAPRLTRGALAQTPRRGSANDDESLQRVLQELEAPAVLEVGRKAQLGSPPESAVYVGVLVPGPPYADERMRVPLELLLSALTRTMASRLFVELREERGLVYFVRDTSWPLSDRGALAFIFGTRRQDLQRALDTLRAALRDARLTAEERRMFRGYVLEHGQRAYEDTVYLAHWYGNRWQRGLPPISFASHLERVSNISDADLDATSAWLSDSLRRLGTTVVLT
jgi:predicted Zn-dependent peptidase